MHTLARCAGLLIATAGAALAAGCGGGAASATGKVFVDGRQVRTGTVTFYGADGVGVSAVLDGDGVYRVTGLAPGVVTVTLSSPPPGEGGAAAATGRAAVKGPKEPKDRPKDPNWFPVPAKFEAAATSGVTASLKSGPNDLDVTFR